ncbi:TIR domain-containing protein, partial [Candidatus Poribacteria bacterium]|nr:TIR domain-containing protein [Candidatus Poribacteria bacterium]
MAQPTVFVSYSHRDEEEKDDLLSHLGVLEHAGLPIEVWNDERIGAGADWKQEITESMERARVAILLISRNFLTSNFILKKEIPQLLERRASEGVTVFPVIAKACAWKRVSWLAKMNVRPKNGIPVWGDNGSHVDEDLAAITEEVADIIEADLRAQLKGVEAARNYAEIVEFSEHILKLNPDDEEVQATHEAAKSTLAEIDRESRKATSAVEAVDYQTAVDSWNRVLEINPDHSEAQKGAKEAQRQLDIQACRQQAKDAFAKRQFDDALNQWRELLKRAPDDEEAKTEIARIENLLELRQRLKELDEAAARGRNAEAVRKWKSISPLLTEDVLATYDRRMARLTQEIETLNTTIQNLKTTADDRDARFHEL